MVNYTGIKALLWDAINPIEAAMLLRFIIINLGYKDDAKKGRLLQLLYVVAWSFMVVINEALLPDFPIDLFLSSIFCLIYGKFYLRGTAINHVFWYFIGIVILAVSDTLVMLIMLVLLGQDNAYNIVMSNFEMRMSGAVISKICIFIYLELLIYYRRKKRKEELTHIDPELIIYLSVDVLIVAVFVYNLMAVSRDKEALIKLFVYLIIFMVLLLILQFYMKSIRKKELMRKQLSLILEEDERRNQHYEEDREIYERLRESRHDAKHHLAYLQYLVENKEYNKMKQYLEQVAEE